MITLDGRNSENLSLNNFKFGTFTFPVPQVVRSAASPHCESWTCPVTKVWLEAWAASPSTWVTWLSWRASTFTCAVSRTATWRPWVSPSVWVNLKPQTDLKAGHVTPCLQSRCFPLWRRWRSSTCRPIRRQGAWSTRWSPPSLWHRWGVCRSTAAAWTRSPLLLSVRTYYWYC